MLFLSTGRKSCHPRSFSGVVWCSPLSHMNSAQRHSGRSRWVGFQMPSHLWRTAALDLPGPRHSNQSAGGCIAYKYIYEKQRDLTEQQPTKKNLRTEMKQLRLMMSNITFWNNTMIHHKYVISTSSTQTSDIHAHIGPLVIAWPCGREPALRPTSPVDEGSGWCVFFFKFLPLHLLIHLGFLLFPCFFWLNLYFNFSVAALLLALSVFSLSYCLKKLCCLFFSLLPSVPNAWNGMASMQRTLLTRRLISEVNLQKIASRLSAFPVFPIILFMLQKSGKLTSWGWLIVYPIVYRVSYIPGG